MRNRTRFPGVGARERERGRVVLVVGVGFRGELCLALPKSNVRRYGGREGKGRGRGRGQGVVGRVLKR